MVSIKKNVVTTLGKGKELSRGQGGKSREGIYGDSRKPTVARRIGNL